MSEQGTEYHLQENKQPGTYLRVILRIVAFESYSCYWVSGFHREYAKVLHELANSSTRRLDNLLLLLIIAESGADSELSATHALVRADR